MRTNVTRKIYILIVAERSGQGHHDVCDDRFCSFIWYLLTIRGVRRDVFTLTEYYLLKRDPKDYDNRRLYREYYVVDDIENELAEMTQVVTDEVQYTR